MATCTAGLEGPLAYEIKELGLDVIDSSDGKALFEGNKVDVIRCNLFLRTAERVFIVLKEFVAMTSDELFENIADFNWHDYVPRDGNITIAKAKTKKSLLNSPRTTQSVAQKAIFKEMMAHYRMKRLPLSGAGFPVNIYIRKNNVLVALDTTGEGLHKRGYRMQKGKAPMRETLAAGLLMLARWNPQIELIDPFCGSGTIIIEAAMMARNQPPGLHRRFLCESWPLFPRELLNDERKKARKAIKNPDINLYASDSDKKMVEYALENAKRAGVANYIEFEHLQMERLKRKSRYGYVLTNPPFGERLEDVDKAREIYKKMRHLKKNLPEWSYFIFSSQTDVEKDFDRKANKKKWVLDSGLKTWLYFFWGPKPDKEKVEE